MPPSTAPEYVDAKEAARLLGVKVSSLYSYVSRGLIRSMNQPGSRVRLYAREDVERAGKRSGGRAGPAIPNDPAESSFRWGQPLLASSITELSDDGPLYRGRGAMELARSGRSFESVAELLWTGLDLPSLTAWEEVDAPSDAIRRIETAARGAPGLTSSRLLALVNVTVGLCVSEKPDFERGSTITDARQLIMLYAGAMALLGAEERVLPPGRDSSVAELLARAMLGSRVKAGDGSVQALNAALIVCADHEMSASTLAARVAASTGADLRACLHAAIVTHSGTRLGGGCDLAEDLLSGVRTVDDLRSAIASLDQAGRTVPGFNPVAYPRGDARARFLLELVAPHAQRNAAFKRLHTVLQEAEQSFGLQPSLEMGLVALAMALQLPRRGASALWAIGRSAGWVAHVIEQRLAGFMLRPRAKYVSPA